MLNLHDPRQANASKRGIDSATPLHEVRLGSRGGFCSRTGSMKRIDLPLEAYLGGHSEVFQVKHILLAYQGLKAMQLADARCRLLHGLR